MSKRKYCLLAPSEADPLKPSYVSSSEWRKVFRCGTALADGVCNDHDGIYYWAGGFPVQSDVQICNYPVRASPPPMDCKQEIGKCQNKLYMVRSLKLFTK